jgi:spore coat polysaccharide biosynthesis protein SpsF
VNVRAIIQARMSSQRFPGKMLAPLAGRAVIARVIEQVSRVLPRARVLVATSRDESDDPLAAYVGSLGVAVFRGERDDVSARFRVCLEVYPCDWFFRVCGDSPLLDPGLLEKALAWVERWPDCDLVTNVFPRTFPPGQSVELLRTATFMRVAARPLDAAEREHVTRYYYNHADLFVIHNLRSADSALAAQRFVVDTLEDLRALERRLESSAPPLAMPVAE